MKIENEDNVVGYYILTMIIVIVLSCITATILNTIK